MAKYTVPKVKRPQVTQAVAEAAAMGAWVELEDSAGNLFRYRIVGPDESDFKRGFISIDSPMAKALLSKGRVVAGVTNRIMI